MIDQLAEEYKNAGKPVVFLEQPVSGHLGNRWSRWWAAFGSGTAGYPLVMVDSGNQISQYYDSSDYYNTYKGMVDTSLARPPQANIAAQSQRVGDHFHFDVQVTNLSGVTLSSSNSATVNAIVYEDGATAGVTERYVRAVAATGISSLANGATGSFSLDTSDISGVDWSKLHTVVLVDYQPGGVGTAYDMLQAAFEVFEKKVYLPLIVKRQ